MASKPKHIVTFASSNNLKNVNDDLNKLDKAKKQAADEFLKKEFKWYDEEIIQTKWSTTTSYGSLQTMRKA